MQIKNSGLESIHSVATHARTHAYIYIYIYTHTYRHEKKIPACEQIWGLYILHMYTYKIGLYMVLGLNLVRGDVAKQGCPLISYILALLFCFSHQ
jgi:hypothetical protein